jgi:hypothetical protein
MILAVLTVMVNAVDDCDRDEQSEASNKRKRRKFRFDLRITFDVCLNNNTNG